MKFYLVTIFFIVISFSAYSNPYHDDFKLVVEEIKKRHTGYAPFPLPFRNLERFDEVVEETNRELDSAKTNLEFYFIMRKFAAKFHDGHMRISSGSQLPQKYLPIEFKMIQGELYIVLSYMSDRSFENTKVVSIGGVAIEEVIKKTTEITSTDYNNQGWRDLQIEAFLTRKGFLDYLGLVSKDETVAIEYQKNDKTKKVVLNWIPNFTDENMDRLRMLGRNEITKRLKKTEDKVIVLKEYSTLYFQLNGLRSNINSEKIKSVFQKIKDNDLSNLVLDLRENTGGMSRWCNLFLRYIVKKERSLYIYRGWKREGDENVMTSPDGKVLIKPIDNGLRFDGNVYILTGPKTFSSATFFVVSIKDNNLGKIIGTKPGNNSVRYGYSSPVMLPNSKMRFNSTKRIWERAKPGVLEYYLEPHTTIPATISDYSQGIDPQWSCLVDEIAQKQGLQTPYLGVKNDNISYTCLMFGRSYNPL